MTGRIIDADVDAIANIDRLTAQVATLKREVDQYEAQLQLERREGRELGLMYAGSNERLQESLTAVEQERDATLHRVTVLEGAINGAKSELSNGEHEEAWKTLERVEKCSICSKSFTDCACTAEQKMQAWMDWYREVTTTTEVAEVVAPPAETPAPTIIGRTVISEPGSALTVTELHLSEETKRALSTNGARIPPVARDASADAPDWKAEALRAGEALTQCQEMERETRDGLCAEIDRLRAEFAAANEEIARLHASMKLQRDATNQALDDRDALDAAVSAARFAFKTGTWPKAWHDAVAAVDARRGGGR